MAFLASSPYISIGQTAVGGGYRAGAAVGRPGNREGFMRLKSKVRAGKIAGNHTQARGVRVKTRVRAGKLAGNHSQAR